MAYNTKYRFFSYLEAVSLTAHYVRCNNIVGFFYKSTNYRLSHNVEQTLKP